MRSQRPPRRKSPAKPPGKPSSNPPANPDLLRMVSSLNGQFGVLSFSMLGLFVLGLFFTLYVASAFFIPVVIAFLLNFLLKPIARWMYNHRIPYGIGAGIIMVALFAVTLFGIIRLSDPATRWLERAPEYVEQAEYKLRGIRESVGRIGEAGEAVEELTRQEEEPVQEVDIQQGTFSDTLMDHTQQFLAGNLVALILLYFLLASGNTFLRKLVHMIPEYRHRRALVHIFHATEQSLSTYLITFTVINIVLGVAVAVAFYLLGMPSPILWGVVAAVLNYIPYIGSLIGTVVIALAALVSYESVGQALVPPLLYLLLTGVEGNFLRPMILGRWLTLNPVAIFIALVFWGWIWGVAGAVLAVPMLMSFKIVCDNIAVLNPIGVFLGR